MNQLFNTYKLLGGKKPASWELPTKEVFTNKEGSEFAEQIKYIPGAGTIFIKDYKGSRKPEKVWFDDGKLRVPKTNKELNDYVQNHPWYNKKYRLENPEQESLEELKILKLRNKIGEEISESEVDKLKAMALAIFGTRSMPWQKNECELNLLKEVQKNPQAVEKKLKDKKYQQKYAAALAISKQVVKYNSTKTAVVWAEGDSNEPIITLAKGENGVTKLGEFLASGTEIADNTLQQIGEALSL
ncbi:MAG: hypothetical protein ACWA5P_01985 [bacterium]